MTGFELDLGVQTLQIVGWALLHSLWIGTVIGIVFALLRPLVRDHISVRYWLGVGCLFAFAGIEIALFANALLSAISLPSPEAVVSATVLGTTPELNSTAVAQQFAMQDGAMPVTMLIGFAWLFGVGISAGRLLRSHRALRLLALDAKFDADAPLARLCRPLLEMLDLRTKVRFALSELIDVPCVIGLFRPMVILPAALLVRMPQDQLELVLLHELSHIKNGDLWINAAQILLEVLMFFHPVVHWISADVRATRERRCDFAVLKRRATPLRYAHALVSLEEYRHQVRNLALAATGGALKARVREILATRGRLVTVNSRRTMRGTVLLSMTAAVAVAGALSSALMPQGNEAPRARMPHKISNPFLEQSVDKAVRPDALLSSSNITEVLVEPVSPQRANDTMPSAPIAQETKPTQVSARRVLAASRASVGWQALPKLGHAQMPADALTLAIATLDENAHNLNLVRRPKVLARVMPVFAHGQRKRQAFTLSFSLNASGVPQQIRLARGQASEQQLLAAQTALAQWRFEPKASAKFIGNRLEQQFSFQELSFDHCRPNVGTRICR